MNYLKLFAICTLLFTTPKLCADSSTITTIVENEDENNFEIPYLTELTNLISKISADDFEEKLSDEQKVKLSYFAWVIGNLGISILDSFMDSDAKQLAIADLKEMYDEFAGSDFNLNPTLHELSHLAKECMLVLRSID